MDLGKYCTQLMLIASETLMSFLDTLLQAIIIQWIFSHMVIGSGAEPSYQGNWLHCAAALHTWVTNLMECVFVFSHTACPQNNSPVRAPATRDRWGVAQGLSVSWRQGCFSAEAQAEPAPVVDLLPKKQLHLNPGN